VLDFKVVYTEKRYRNIELLVPTDFLLLKFPESVLNIVFGSGTVVCYRFYISKIPSNRCCLKMYRILNTGNVQMKLA